jgi:gliding motility-associated lipoprotein GldH
MLLGACSQTPLYDQSETLPQSQWPLTQATRFAVAVADTAESYDIYFRITNGTYYAYSNLWLFCKTSIPGRGTHIDTLEIELADVQGRWKGDKSGDNYTALYPYKQQIKFPQAGQYEFLVVQGMRDSILTDISQFGLRIEKSAHKK